MDSLNVGIENSWKLILEDEFQKNYFKNLRVFLINEGKRFIIYPKKTNIFRAFLLTPFENVKIVIIGQDPYHGEGQANGLAFSVNNGIKPPPSLKNILKELYSDICVKNSDATDLEKWARQGVLLLNTILTVRKKLAGSHQKIGWERFTDEVIQRISSKKSGVIFFLWGNFAKKKEHLIDKKKHYVLKASHPSPLSAYNGFFGCKHFSKANKILENNNKKPINWKL